ncbi:cupin domain-containing protein [Candidatus Latescibacterota bacterium]
MKIMVALLFCIIAFTPLVDGQKPWYVTTQPGEEVDWYNLDPKPLDLTKEPNADLFMRHYSESEMIITNGCLKEWQIIFPLKGNDPEFPEEKGHVATAILNLNYAILGAGLTTDAEKLQGKQKIYYVADGEGEIVCGNKMEVIETDALILLPEKQTYTIKNTAGRPLAMYVITEPVPEDFKPSKDMKIIHVNESPINGTKGHWSHCTSGSFGRRDGLATLTGMCPVWYMPMTIGQPHSHNPGIEEIWFVVDGDYHLLLGKQFYNPKPGTAYKVPPTGYTPHSNMNLGEKPVKTFWMMYQRQTTDEQAKYGILTPRPLNLEVDADIDKYISSYKEHPPYIRHKSLLERDMLTKNNGEFAKPILRGGCLNYIDRFTHATLMAYHKTEPITLENTQEVFYVISGNGKISTKEESYDLYPGVSAFVPLGLEFTIENTGSEALEMYLISEKVKEGFKPRNTLLVKDEKKTGASHYGHWTYESSILVDMSDGLSQLYFVNSVVLPPNTFAQPHSHNSKTEEVWATVDSDLTFMLGKQPRKIDPGYSYMVPPDGKTFHSNINLSNKPVRLFYFGLFDGEK